MSHLPVRCCCGVVLPGFGRIMGADTDPQLELRAPTPADAAAMWRLVRDAGSLDLNSVYAYLLICSDFAATSVVATSEAGLHGFVAAYRPPTDPDAVFVWQVGVANDMRGRGLGRRLLLATLDRPANRDARWLTATVTPDNAPSLALFGSAARDLGVDCERHERFGAELFPEEAGQHEAELELRIGPLPDLALEPDLASDRHVA